MPRFDRSPDDSPGPGPTGRGRREPRLLFLDDDPERAEVFLTENPKAVWVKTASDCIARLDEPWDEVHLDHDLGGEHFVDLSREDCGMEVVRWLSMFARPHLKPTRFFVHSHNDSAATMMGMQLMMSGYTVEVRPFGSNQPPPSPLDLVGGEPTPALPPLPRVSTWGALKRLARRLLRRESPEDYGYSLTERPEPPLEMFDLNWTPPREPGPQEVERLDFSWTRPPQNPRPPEPGKTPERDAGPPPGMFPSP